MVGTTESLPTLRRLDVVRVVVFADRTDRVLREIACFKRRRVFVDRAVGAGVDRLSETGRAVDAVTERGGGGEVFDPVSMSCVEVWWIEQCAVGGESAEERDERICEDEHLGWVLDLMEFECALSKERVVSGGVRGDAVRVVAVG